MRAWQRAALQALADARERDFLAVATPGAGKTTFALTAARRLLIDRAAQRLVVVVPTQHLKLQWSYAAEDFGIHLDPNWSAHDGTLPSDVHGIVVTYQQVAANPDALRPLVRTAFVVLDEIHHAADSRTWGDAVRHAFDPAVRRLCLSGTPFRSDQSTIPFVRYVGDEAEADYEYGYGEALADRGVVRPVYFPRINGRMEWSTADGLTWRASFDDPLGRVRASQRLRTALDLEGEWLPAVLEKAHRQLLHVREGDPTAGGMVIAMDQDHARGIGKQLGKLVGRPVTVATSDDPRASEKIAEFSAGTSPWIVAVRMVSEGVDIPRLRVGVYATHTITDLFFRQAVGRLVRFKAGLRQQRAYMFIPDDVRLRAFAMGIAEQRRHNLRKPDEREAPERDPEAEREEEQLALFSAISAVAIESDGKPLEPVEVPDDEDGEPIPGLVGDDDDFSDDEFVLLPPNHDEILPTPAPDPALLAPPRAGRSRRRELREMNSARVRSLVHSTRRGHAEINAELNRRVGIKRITEATVRQLERRLEAADHWIARGRPPG